MLGRKTSERHVARSASSSGDAVGVKVARVFDLPGVLLNDRVEGCVCRVPENLNACRQLRHI